MSSYNAKATCVKCKSRLRVSISDSNESDLAHQDKIFDVGEKAWGKILKIHKQHCPKKVTKK